MNKTKYSARHSRVSHSENIEILKNNLPLGLFSKRRNHYSTNRMNLFIERNSSIRKSINTSNYFINRKYIRRQKNQF